MQYISHSIINLVKSAAGQSPWSSITQAQINQYSKQTGAKSVKSDMDLFKTYEATRGNFNASNKDYYDAVKALRATPTTPTTPAPPTTPASSAPTTPASPVRTPKTTTKPITPTAPTAPVQQTGAATTTQAAVPAQRATVQNRGVGAAQRAVIGKNYKRQQVPVRMDNGGVGRVNSQGVTVPDMGGTSLRQKEETYLNNTYGTDTVNKANNAASILAGNFTQAMQQNPEEATRRAERYLTHGAISQNNRIDLARRIFNVYDARASRGQLNPNEQRIYELARQTMGADVAGAGHMQRYNKYEHENASLPADVQAMIGYNPAMRL